MRHCGVGHTASGAWRAGGGDAGTLSATALVAETAPVSEGDKSGGRRQRATPGCWGSQFARGACY